MVDIKIPEVEAYISKNQKNLQAMQSDIAAFDRDFKELNAWDDNVYLFTKEVINSIQKNHRNLLTQMEQLQKYVTKYACDVKKYNRKF